MHNDFIFLRIGVVGSLLLVINLLVVPLIIFSHQLTNLPDFLRRVNTVRMIGDGLALILRLLNS